MFKLCLLNFNGATNCLIFYSGMICDYDIALHRLKCYCNDVYYGITPSINTVYYNCGPPVFACRFCTTPGYEEILALANEDGKVAFQDTKIKNKKYLYRSLEGTQVGFDFNCYLTNVFLSISTEILMGDMYIFQGTL